MTRFALTLEFDGGPFFGLQRQGHGPSVQEAVERAVLEITGETVTMHSAGRTDSGVHALAMVSPVDIAKKLTPFRLMVETLAHLDQIKPEPQSELGATYAGKIDKSEARIDWSKPAELIEREVRAFAPFPGSWFELDGERIKLLEARVIGVNGFAGTVLDDELTVACGDAALRPVTMQRAGKPAMGAAEFLRGMPVPVGTVLR